MIPYYLCEPSFPNTYALLSPAQRSHIKQLVDRVRISPERDDVWKIGVPYLGAMYVKAFDDDGYWLLYFVQEGILNCVACGLDSPYTDVLVDLTPDLPFEQ